MAKRSTTLEAFLDNKLPAAVDDARLFAGSAGESPSRYSRSPGMWNAAFRDFELDASYVPFDVKTENLAGFIAAVRADPGFIGGNVTVPHKLAIMELLDDIDPMARQIGAVNTYVRTAEGKLIGYNSDADGLLGSLLRPMPGQPGPFIETLSGMNVLLLGAGGAGRACAFALASKLDSGRLLITNRTVDRSNELAADVARAYPIASAVTLDEALARLGELDLVVNASSVGQSGLRHLPNGRATCLEPFSSLVAADPVVLATPTDEQAFYRQWFEESLPAIEANQAAAARALASCQAHTAFVDAVYSPDETVLLRQARLHGHKTRNGKGMLIMQAAESFIKRMTRPHLVEAGYDPDTLYDRVVTTMEAAF
jgi:shikimate dehydrogenase